MSNDIGDRIRQARIARGLTTTAVAKALGDVERSSVSQWEHGHTKPKIERLAQLARVLGVDAAWLTTGAGESGLQPTRGDRTVGQEVPLLSAQEIIAKKAGAGTPLLRTHFDAGKGAVAHRLGSKMLEPLVPAGSLVVIAPARPSEPGSIIAAVTAGRLVFGRLEIEATKRGEVWHIAALTPGFGRLPVDRRDVVGVISEYTVQLAI